MYVNTDGVTVERHSPLRIFFVYYYEKIQKKVQAVHFFFQKKKFVFERIFKKKMLRKFFVCFSKVNIVFLSDQMVQKCSVLGRSFD